ncbi:hypothetical protein SLEP1_g48213 [Rubroshorea leprosula]|uniref:Secreted protein n=1 Tax=Rubroshorea leprosula TaxID=152421 RepID=A0AAV5LV14_9ROSI|nr:hypothetical protein SLEP1_g48213 [Rubroshorea leprosula]
MAEFSSRIDFCVFLLCFSFLPRPSAPDDPPLPPPISGRKSGEAWGFSPSSLVLEPRNSPPPAGKSGSALLCPPAALIVGANSGHFWISRELPLHCRRLLPLPSPVLQLEIPVLIVLSL